MKRRIITHEDKEKSRRYARIALDISRRQSLINSAKSGAASLPDKKSIRPYFCSE